MAEPIGVLVADDSKQVRDSIRAMLDLEDGFLVVGEAENGLEAIEQARTLSPDVILMDINMPKMDGITAAREIMKTGPANIIVVSVQGESDYFRKAMQAGARDYLVKPFTCDELVNAIRNAHRLSDLAAVYSREPEPEKKGKLITVFGTKGGVGKTTIATNLAVSLAMKTRLRVAAVDLDLEFGAMATMFGQKPVASIVDLCHVEGELKKEYLDRVMTPSANNLVNVLASPPTPELASEVDGEGRRERDRNYVAEILDLLQAAYDFVVIDTASNFREINLVSFDRSDLILLTASPDIPTLHNTAKGLDILLDRLEYSRDKVRLVLNRADSASGLSVDDIAKGLNYPISHTIPSDGTTAIWAANAGQPFILRRAKTPIAEAISQIAGSIIAGDRAKASRSEISRAQASQVQPQRRKLFGIL